MRIKNICVRGRWRYDFVWWARPNPPGPSHPKTGWPMVADTRPTIEGVCIEFTVRTTHRDLCQPQAALLGPDTASRQT